MVRPIKTDFEVSQKRVRSAITNGQRHFAAVDHRSSSARRFKDILHALTEALGGNEALSPQEKALVWKCSVMQLWTELIEARWFRKETNEPPSYEIFKTHTRAVNSMRRMFRDLGLKRRARELPQGTTFSQEEVVANLERFGLPAGGEFDPPVTKEQMQRPVTARQEKVVQKLKDAANAK